MSHLEDENIEFRLVVQKVRKRGRVLLKTVASQHLKPGTAVTKLTGVIAEDVNLTRCKPKLEQLKTAQVKVPREKSFVVLTAKVIGKTKHPSRALVIMYSVAEAGVVKITKEQQLKLTKNMKSHKKRSVMEKSAHIGQVKSKTRIQHMIHP